MQVMMPLMMLMSLRMMTRPVPLGLWMRIRMAGARKVRTLIEIVEKCTWKRIVVPLLAKGCLCYYHFICMWIPTGGNTCSP